MRLEYNQNSLRGHLLQFVKSQTACKKRQAKPRDQHTALLPLYCVCRQIEDGKMIECEISGERFHDTCVSLPDYIWSDCEKSWQCPQCAKC